jgi:hypothetical protein
LIYYFVFYGTGEFPEFEAWADTNGVKLLSIDPPRNGGNDIDVRASIPAGKLKAIKEQWPQTGWFHKLD